MSKYGQYTGNQKEAMLNRIVAAGGSEAVLDGLLTGAVEVTVTWVKHILATVVFNITQFLGADWKVWKGPADGQGLEGEEDRDSRNLDITEVDWVQVLRETCLKSDETSIKGEEKLRRLKEMGHIRLGENAFLALWQDYQANKKKSVLEWLYTTFGVTYLDFFGLILRGPGGGRYVLYLYRYGDGQWLWYARWLGRGWHAGNFSALLASPALVAQNAGT